MHDGFSILGISGSLRAESTNTAVLRAAAAVTSPGVSIILYDGLCDLPHFNPDLEGKEPLSVLAFPQQVQAADAIFVSSPEYAHGVPGLLKNARRVPP